jgi:hypothetical protein
VHAGTHSLNPFCYDSITGIQAACDDPPVIDAITYSDSSNVDLVVSVYDRDLISAL